MTAAPRLLRVREAAQRLGVHPDTVRALIKRGELPLVRLGPRLWRVKEADLEQLLRGSRETTETEEVSE